MVIVTQNLPQPNTIGDYGALSWDENNINTLPEFGSIKPVFNYTQLEITSAYIQTIRG